MSNYVRFVRLHAKPGTRDEVMRLWEEYQRDFVISSDGVKSFYYCYDNDDPDAIIVFMLASDQEITKQPWFAEYHRKVEAYHNSPSEVYMATPQWVKNAAV